MNASEISMTPGKKAATEAAWPGFNFRNEFRLRLTLEPLLHPVVWEIWQCQYGISSPINKLIPLLFFFKAFHQSVWHVCVGMYVILWYVYLVVYVLIISLRCPLFLYVHAYRDIKPDNILLDMSSYH